MIMNLVALILATIMLAIIILLIRRCINYVGTQADLLFELFTRLNKGEIK